MPLFFIPKYLGTMRFIQTHSIGSDCTAPYDVVDYQAKTVVEFINEMLQQCQHEWGSIRVWAKGFPIIGKDHLLSQTHIEYKNGELLGEIPDDWQYKAVVKVISSGGWGNMDYQIYVKP